MKMKAVPFTEVTKVIVDLPRAYGRPQVIVPHIDGEDDLTAPQYVYFSEGYRQPGLDHQNMIHGYCAELRKQFPGYDFRWFCGPLNQGSCGIRVSINRQPIKGDI